MQESQHIESGLWVMFEFELNRSQEAEDTGRYWTTPDGAERLERSETKIIASLAQHKAIIRNEAMNILQLQKNQTFEILSK